MNDPKCYLLGTWASADFFPGEDKIFQGEGETYYLHKKHIIFLKKNLKTYYFWPAKGEGGGGYFEKGPPFAAPPLWTIDVCALDAHGYECFFNNQNFTTNVWQNAFLFSII